MSFWTKVSPTVRIFSHNIYSEKSSYAWLLLDLTGILILSPIMIFSWGRIVIAVLFSLAILLMIQTLKLSRHFLQLMRGLAILALCLQIYAGAQDYRPGSPLELVLNLFISFFTLAAIIAIWARLAHQDTADINTISGGICLYLLFGILWRSFYEISLFFQPDGLGQYDFKENPFALIYFSYTTLTTLGYGDITPTTPTTMCLSNLQAIFGQLYPAIFLARLVSLSITPSNKC